MSSGNVELSSNNSSSHGTKLSSTTPTLPSASLSDDEVEHSKNSAKEQGRKNQLSLLMYVIGGRVGQVTVFNGPISLWKLDLTKTF